MATARIDWPHLLGDIAHLLGEPTNDGRGRAELGTPLLARALGVPRGTLRNWLDGSEPKHADGERLIERWCALTGRDRAFAPLARAVTSAGRVR